MRHEPISVRRDFYRDVAAIALHLQGDPPELGPSGLDNQKNPCSTGRFPTLRRPGFGRGAHLAARSGLAPHGGLHAPLRPAARPFAQCSRATSGPTVP
jgi:hypothetical protein